MKKSRFFLFGIFVIGIQLLAAINSFAQQNPEYHTHIFSTNLKLHENGEIDGAVKFELEGALADSLKAREMRKGNVVLDQFAQDRLPGYLIVRTRLMNESTREKFVFTAQVKNSQLVNWSEEGETTIPAYLNYRPVILEELKNYPDGVYSEVVRLQFEVPAKPSKVGLPQNINFVPEGAACTFTYTPFVSNGVVRVISKVGYKKEGDPSCKPELSSAVRKLNSGNFRLK